MPIPFSKGSNLIGRICSSKQRRNAVRRDPLLGEGLRFLGVGIVATPLQRRATNKQDQTKNHKESLHQHGKPQLVGIHPHWDNKKAEKTEQKASGFSSFDASTHDVPAVTTTH